MGHKAPCQPGASPPPSMGVRPPDAARLTPSPSPSAGARPPAPAQFTPSPSPTTVAGPPAAARLTPISPDREVPGEPRGDSQHVVQHQHGSEAALLFHASRGQLVGQRQPAHLDHGAETGKWATASAQTLHPRVPPASVQQKLRASHDL